MTPIFSLESFVPGIERLQVYFHEDAGAAGLFDHAALSDSGAASKESETADAGTSKLDTEAWEEFVGISWRDMILLAGGIFLIYNSVREIHTEVEGHEQTAGAAEPRNVSFRGLLIKITIMDIVFSLDSVITAVGMADQLWIMFVAVIVAVGVMILFADQVGNFVDRNPTVKMLALNFLLLIGVMLLAEGIGTPISKGYIYFAMAFSLLVEMFNIRVRNRAPAK